MRLTILRDSRFAVCYIDIHIDFIIRTKTCEFTALYN